MGGGGIRRDKLVRGLFQSIDDIEHALASPVLDTTLLIAPAILLLYIVMLRGLPARNSRSVIVPTVCLYACAADRSMPLPQPLVPPMVVQHVQPTATPTRRSHLVNASWYGPGLAGLKTASGEVFNPRRLTAASKSLPIGSLVRITNPKNGKSVNVRINDRGPFVRGRSLDLSQRAAAKIGIIDNGVARVKVGKPALMHVRRMRKEHARKHWLHVAWLCAPCHGGEHPSRRNKPHHMTSHRFYRIYR
jgi:rare lipoprotein A